MVVYSIKDIEKLTGVKAHTIRIWEKRYNIIAPKRTKTNIRYYDEQDLKLVMNIALLNGNGYKISKIAKLSLEEREKIAASIAKVGKEFENQIDAITYAILNLEEQNINLILMQNIRQQGLKYTMTNLVYPLLEKMGIMWVSGSISEVHERFVTNLLRNTIVHEIRSLNEKREKDRPKFLLYLPLGQSHELSLLYMHFLLLNNGNDVTMMGIECSLSSVGEAMQLKEFDYVFTILNDKLQEGEVQTYINTLSSMASKETQIALTGYQMLTQTLELNDNVLLVKNMEDILELKVPKEQLQNNRVK